MKICQKCGVELVVGDNWYASYAKKGAHICIPCKKVQNRNYYQEHQGESIAYQRQYNQEHQEEIATRNCQWYKEHRKEKASYNRKYRRENYDRIRKHWAKHKEERAAHGRKWRQERREEDAARKRRWQLENPERCCELAHRYRARKLNATIEDVDEQRIYELYDNTCIYCGSKESLSLDHIVPLNGGGAHCEDNLTVACRSCNASKNDRPLIEWIQTRPDLQVWVM